MEVTNITIIGNGFDLAHNLPTSYSNFLTNILSGNIKHQAHQELISIDTTFSKDLKSFLSRNWEQTQLIDKTTFTNEFFKKLILQFAEHNWCDIEQIFLDQLLTTSEISKLNQDFEGLISSLQFYLEQVTKSIRSTNYYNSLFNYLKRDRNYFLNFNYTNTCEHYGQAEYKPINIHGRINSKSNPIVFGFSPTREVNDILIDKGDEYLKYIKKYWYKSSEEYDKLLNIIEVSQSIEINILGHSMGDSDNLIINQLLKQEKVNSIRLFYFQNKANYTKSIMQIDRITRADKVLDKILSFQNSMAMPQIDDDVMIMKRMETLFK